VVATHLGAVPEVIEHGRSGILCDSIADMPRAIAAAAMLDRAGVRASAVQRFSPGKMAAQFEATYEAAVRGERAPAGSRSGPGPGPSNRKAEPAGTGV
jgi:glycosyltransferase involved in cell wall biosynthesis